VIIRHQRASSSGKDFRQLARYIRGRSAQPRTTWFLAANLPGVTTTDNLELACRLVEAVHAQNTRAGSDRTYHLVISLHPEGRSLDTKELRHVVEDLVGTLGFSEHQNIAARDDDKDHEHVHVAINKIHPETFRIHSPAWDQQKLFAAGRALEAELDLTPLRSMAREREKLPRKAADCEAHQGVDSFARWARKTLAPVLRSTELRSWDDMHDACGRLGVVLWLHGNGLVFEGAARGVRVKGSCVGREFSERRRFKEKYRHQRSLLAALPVSGRDRKRLSQQLALRQAIESRALRRKLANQRQAIRNSPHPGTWRHFVASRAAHGDARAIRLLPRREQERSHGDLDRGS
jgi:hypothetical protein